jgi:ferric-chelate reductase
MLEIASAQNSSKYRLPTRMQLIFVVKKSQDICLLNSISSLLQNQSSEGLHLKLKIFVTQEVQANPTARELLSDSSDQLQTVHFSTKCSNHAIYGLESFLCIAALAGFSCIVFLVFLICFNHIFVPSQKKTSKVSKEKTPSSVVDLLLLSSFLIALTCSSLVAIVLRRRRLKNEIPAPVSQKPGKAMDRETGSSLEEHEIHFGGRPDFHGTFMYSLYFPWLYL